MLKKWVTWVNYSLTGIITLFLLSALFFLWTSPGLSLPHAEVRKTQMPRGAFTRPIQDYQAIGDPALSLDFSPLSVQLPDIKRYLVYYGKNGRPDAKEERPLLYFSFLGNKAPSPIPQGEKFYLKYDKSLSPPQYVFSPENTKTPLWIEASAQGNQALIKVGMKSNQENDINESTTYTEFTIPEKEFVRVGGMTWELGKWRVDSTLLARQKTRWFGIDRFLERHGGKEYKEWEGKHRIDFGEGQETYSAYIGQGSCLIWKVDRWQAIRPGENSLPYPLMCVKKIDERIMNLELWDIDGKGKVNLNLIKSNEAWVPQNLEKNFKFIGSRTRSQFIFEINNERMTLSPYDWLLLTEGGWKKLITPQEIDDYVERRLIGPLFVFDRIERKEDRQVIQGTLFNAARTEMAPIELPLQQNVPPSKLNNEGKKQKVKESNVKPMIKNGSRQGISPATGEPPDDEDDDEDDEEIE